MWKIQLRSAALKGRRWRRYHDAIESPELGTALHEMAERLKKAARNTDALKDLGWPIAVFAQLEVSYVPD